MPDKFNQSGVIHLWLILIIIGVILGGVVLSHQFKPQSPAPIAVVVPSSPTSSPVSKQVDKNDFKALEKYCKEEALKLPEAPFTYKSKEGPSVGGPMPWVNKYIPKDKKESEKKSCAMAYSFDGRSAYTQMGAVYPMGINQFDAAVIRNLSGKIDSSWERVLEPGMSPDKFTLIYKRENQKMGTVDYLDVFSGSLVLYIKFNTYYK